MKVNFRDIEFGCFEPHIDYEYDGKTYRVIEVECETEFANGTETHLIAEHSLGVELEKNDDTDTDNEFSYYADNNDGVYYILETITGEEVE